MFLFSIRNLIGMISLFIKANLSDAITMVNKRKRSNPRSNRVNLKVFKDNVERLKPYFSREAMKCK